MKALCIVSSKGFIRGTIYNITMLLEGMNRMYVMDEKGQERTFSQESPAFEIL